ncbi:hypothetical protein DSM106972_060070 [Dulcicalothrix desertica PCC 7102]|uniref:protein-glutamate O-methyltransferase n=1 Tax=Dulcicalothrix desertica PCC 7102 TaxID=232991 RepID=A0A433V912_9CYAN|nr:CheR family methyltransferase [Dulcicalothrix desertica]RUT02529.1 hypothetical protein DSM106972_060070 [Dulcicalothrix desertica PCC 7102]TWH55254.1 two-component system CheB/CheR fusion protein [Dulcicalothrix desertica PCC 7102]
MSQLKSKQEFEALLNYLNEDLGCDLTVYKRPSLVRRFEHRMQELEIGDYTDYLEYLKNHPQECVPLLNTILINFSSFFRDRDSWDYLANAIIPEIITSKQPGEQIRVWSAGCASGQETYTIAILLAEMLGIDQYLERVQIFATDVDKDALLQAHRGSYNELEIVGIDDKILSKYFDKKFENNEQRYIINSKLRRKIIFGRHDLALDAPMSKIDLLVCRNVLIYLNSEIQAGVIVRFHFALNDNGVLFLGSAESLLNSQNIFNLISIKHRIFAKAYNLTLQQHLLIRPTTRQKKKAMMNTLTDETQIWKTAFLASAFPQIAVDCKSRLLLANEQAQTLFGLNNSDLLKRVQELKIGRLLLLINFWSFNELKCNPRSTSFKPVEWVTDGNKIYFDIYITPILTQSGAILGANLTFINVTSYTELQHEIKCSNSEITKLTQKLQLVKVVLNTTINQLESTQQELDSAYQEIDFRNELL